MHWVAPATADATAASSTPEPASDDPAEADHEIAGLLTCPAVPLAAPLPPPPLCSSRSCNGAAGLRARHDCVPLSKA
ncbi:hypothetical protein Slala05_82180 [Streptomyces lavendulae subsp. lavendulae]|nr:hypothetical protein Slala05_82180 [Streptomyces lavendulae subsp. lavendulae]